MSDVDNEDVDTGLDECRSTFEEIASRANRADDEEPSFAVLARERPISKEEQVAERDEASNAPLDAIVVHQLFGFILADAERARMQLLEGRHEVVDGAPFELRPTRDITVGQETREDSASRRFLHGDRRNLMAPGERFGFGELRAPWQASRVLDDALWLRLTRRIISADARRHCAMDDSDPAFEREGLGHLRFGHTVHVRRDDGKLELDRLWTGAT